MCNKDEGRKYFQMAGKQVRLLCAYRGLVTQLRFSFTIYHLVVIFPHIGVHTFFLEFLKFCSLQQRNKIAPINPSDMPRGLCVLYELGFKTLRLSYRHVR